ncbi:MAG: type II toxin-antitoxin system YafQ family toxin [Bacteroidales bacterium]|nr:type II toxin-antitoxin system YafQ family toxin [Bacteroidales bacterium]
MTSAKRHEPCRREREVCPILNIVTKYKEYSLTGKLRGVRECHIQADWLLIYRIIDRKCLLYLLNTGTHADLFGK